MTKTLSMELGKFKIRVNALCPGTIKGDRMIRVAKDKAKLLKISKKSIEKEFISMASMDAIDINSFSIDFFEIFKSFALSFATLIILSPFIVPGHNAFTRILNLPSSIDKVFVIPTIAHLLAA